MSLYDKNYAQNNNYANSEILGEERYAGRISSLIKQTYQLLTASLIAATAGAFVGMNFFSISSPILFLVVEIALIFGMQFATKSGSNTIALVLLFAFTFITGLSLGPILNFYIGAGAGNIVTQAFLMTAIIFGGLSVYAMNTKTDFSSWGKVLFFALLAIIVVSLLNYFFFSSPLIHIIVSAIAAFVFCCYILFDTQNIIRGNYTSPIMAAVSLYLDIFNLFISLLNILGFLNRE